MKNSFIFKMKKSILSRRKSSKKKSFLFGHLAKKLVRRQSLSSEVKFLENLIKTLDNSKKNAEKTLRDLKKRKLRSFIDPFWDKWIEDNNYYVSINKPKDILGTMKVLQEENGWKDKLLPTRFMISNRKRIKKQLKK